MVGLDTNVLVRYLAQDEVKQAALATRLIEHTLTANKPGFVSLVVLVELHWVMCSLYSVTKLEWLGVVDDLLASQNIFLEQRDVVQAAGQVCRSSKAGFVDALIDQVAKAAGCQHTMSFDRAAVRNAGMAEL
jgi:predicted nucleic-acid-binding protein